MARNRRPADGPMTAGVPKPVVIRTPLPTKSLGSRNCRRWLPAGIASAAAHAALLCSALFLNVELSAGPPAQQTSYLDVEFTDDHKTDSNLLDENIGTSADQPAGIDVARIEDFIVTGPDNPADNAGIMKPLAEGFSRVVTPPTGFGDDKGQAGADKHSLFGPGNVFDLARGAKGFGTARGDLRGRASSTTKQFLVERDGGNAASEAAVARGLRWLAQHQAADGHWSLDGFHQHGHCNCTGPGMNNDIAATAFGLLPLLGGGQTHKGGGMFAKNVERGLTYLMARQDRNGDFGGGMYAHGLATIAMCEAYGLTSDPRLKRSAQSGLNFIVYAQGSGGGWDYSPRTARNDTSVGGWQLMGIKSGQMAGLEVPTKTLANASRWLDKCASPDGGGYGYSGPAETPTMSAVGLLCREYLGWGPRNPGLAAGIKRLRALPPDRANTIYYNYYATQVMHHAGGDAWQFWNPRMRDLLVARQDQGAGQHAHQNGSWSPAGDVHGGAGGRMMVTSLSLLTLEVYYRHLPLYRREMGGTK